MMGFDAPVAAVECQQASGVGALGGMVGQAVDDLGGRLACLLVERVPLDGEGLSDMGEVQVGVEPGGGPNGTRFQAPVLERERFAEVRLAALFEKQGECRPAGSAGCLWR